MNSDSSKAVSQSSPLFAGVSLCYLLWVNAQYQSEFEGLVGVQVFWALVIGGVCGLVVVLAILLVDRLVRQVNRPRLTFCWACFLPLFLLSFYVDLLLFRKTAVHFATLIRLVVGSGWHQLQNTQEILGFDDQYIYGVLVVVVLVGVLSGIALTFVQRWISWSRVHISAGWLFGVFSLVVLGYASVAVLGPQNESFSRVWREAHRVLPTTPTIGLEPPGRKIPSGPIRPFQAEGDIGRIGAREPLNPRPDIYVISIESMRGDCLNASIAPNLTEFRSDCVPFRDTLAASNASHTSWFSLFSARYPLYFGMARRDRSSYGSSALKRLQDLGYQVHVCSSSYLAYHQTDKIVFGERLNLADSFLDQRHCGTLSRPERDRRVMQLLREVSSQDAGGKLVATFLASSHHDYQWPSDFDAPFQPVAEMWNYYLRFDISAEELGKIRNRYWNSINFADHLVGDFLLHLKEIGRYEDSIILVTSDHGEAFLEHGKLVHASDLHREQIHVPFLLKLPNGMRNWDRSVTGVRIASHTDFLPTVFDILELEPDEALDGRSLLRREVDFVLTVDDNGNRDPFQFCLHRGEMKAWFSYRSDATLIGAENVIYWTRLTDRFDSPTGIDVREMGSVPELLREFCSGLETLYPQGQWNSLK